MPLTIGTISSSYRSPWGAYTDAPPVIDSSLRVWLNANDSTKILDTNGDPVLTGGLVSKWIDGSGANIEFVGANVTKQAQGIFLSSTSSSLNAGRQSWFESSFDPFTLFFVMRSTNNYQKRMFLAGSKYVNVGFSSRFSNSIALHQTNGDSLIDTTGSSSNVDVNTIIVAEYYTGKVAKLRVLKNAFDTSSSKIWATNWPAATNPMQFGNASWTGYIKECLIYDRNLTTAETESIVTNLNNKWQVKSP